MPAGSASSTATTDWGEAGTPGVAAGACIGSVRPRVDSLTPAPSSREPEPFGVPALAGDTFPDVDEAAQCWMSPDRSTRPTAHASPVPGVASTPASRLSTPGRFGLGTTVQDPPSQCRVRVRYPV